MHGCHYRVSRDHQHPIGDLLEELEWRRIELAIRVPQDVPRAIAEPSWDVWGIIDWVIVVIWGSKHRAMGRQVSRRAWVLTGN